MIYVIISVKIQSNQPIGINKMASLDIDNACALSASEPVGTTSNEALACNMKTIDAVVNSTDLTTTNRVSKTIDTLEGLSQKFGWIIAGEFVTGFAITNRNEVGQAIDGTVWRYTGELPFAVTAGTVPSNPDYVQLVETDHSELTNLNAAGGHDSIYDRHVETAAEVVGVGLSDGDYIWIDERKARFKVTTGTPNGTDKIDAGGGLVAELIKGQVVNLKNYGTPTESETESLIESGELTVLDFDFVAVNTASEFICPNTPDYRNFTVNSASIYSDKISGQFASVPDDFKVKPLFSAQCVSPGFVKTTLDVSKYDIAANTPASDVKTYYVDPINGLSTNTGGENDPLDSLARVGLKEDASPSPEPVLQIFARAGRYDQSKALGSGLVGMLKPYSLKRWDASGVIEQLQGRYGDFQVWVDLTGGVWSTALSNCISVFDKAILNDLGDYGLYTKVNNDAELTTAGTWFQDGGTLKINTLDDREPDADIGIGRIIGSSPINSSVTDAEIYLEYTHYFGGSDGLSLSTSSEAGNLQLACNNVVFGYSGGNGLETDGVGLTISNNCVAKYNLLDGFNYHSNQGTLVTEGLCIEVNCAGYRNGYDWSPSININNGSTAHDECIVMRYGTVAFENQGPNIVDVNNSYSYSFACHAYDSVRDNPHPNSADFNFATSGGVTGTYAWMQCCTASKGDSDYSLASTAEQVKLRDCNLYPSIYGAPSISSF
ncbi:hypothetical protein N9980_00600 [bacterium]|nr:hypothetical protein [bacterium]